MQVKAHCYRPAHRAYVPELTLIHIDKDISEQNYWLNQWTNVIKNVNTYTATDNYVVVVNDVLLWDSPDVWSQMSIQ